MPQKINSFFSGGFIEFDSGCFDDFCVYVTKSDGFRYAPRDVQYFNRLKSLSQIYGAQKIFDDFIVIYNRTTKLINPQVFKLIEALSKWYENDAAELEIWFNVLYAGMIAEENKAHAILKKRIKRLGLHQVLIDGISPKEAAVFSKGKKWQELDQLMISKGF